MGIAPRSASRSELREHPGLPWAQLEVPGSIDDRFDACAGVAEDLRTGQPQVDWLQDPTRDRSVAGVHHHERSLVSVTVGVGVHLVQHPVLLAPGENHLVEVTLDVEGEGEEEDTRGATFWQNPLTAALLVTGSAVLIGLLLEKAVEDADPVQSPSVPLN